MKQITQSKIAGLFHAVSFSMLLMLGVATEAKADPLPTDTARSYDALSDGTEDTLGDTAELSRTSASFSKLAGHMTLQHAGVRSDDTDTEFSGDVYQVLNADEFFAKNKGKNGFCDQPVRWLTILDISKSVGPDAVRIGMLTIDDWRQYTSTSLGGCSSDTFKLQ
ncbi:hypothetical protein QBK99_24855 [Corticibacterium sp. UT-5YL-CI-8]|nr:hypothetical protein [Tianweitania sp. UT-5YL-CI-8]